MWVVDELAFFLCHSRCRAGMGRWAARRMSGKLIFSTNVDFGFPKLAWFSFLLGVGGNSKGQFTIFYS